MDIVYSKAGASTIYGVACGGPISMDVACAEMCILDQKCKRWLALSWQSEIPQYLQFIIASASVFESYSGISDPQNDDNIHEEEANDQSVQNNLLEACFLEKISEYNGPYKEFLPSLVGILLPLVKVNGFLSEDTFEEGEEIWSWLKECSFSFGKEDLL